MSKPGERQRRWRQNNAERAREYKREYLRRKWLPSFLAETGYPEQQRVSAHTGTMIGIDPADPADPAAPPDSTGWTA